MIRFNHPVRETRTTLIQLKSQDTRKLVKTATITDLSFFLDARED